MGLWEDTNRRAEERAAKRGALRGKLHELTTERVTFSVTQDCGLNEPAKKSKKKR